MKFSITSILKWIASTLLTAAVQQGAERIVQSRTAKRDAVAAPEADQA